ncbi:hypothetical protein F2Q68_00019762 [Brassica cretica]|uniref:Uncharacterized protein n=1 Tax=Brassica cretica TaxID=69181 RepID=A0A8S9FZU1_BRACR|nr:hypothetical protein F2Q68_00019762 [Brassica cretica]
MAFPVLSLSSTADRALERKAESIGSTSTGTFVKILQPLDQGFWSKATTSPPKLISESRNSKTLRVSSKDPLEILMWLLSFLKEDPARAEILAGSLAEGEIYELWMRTVLTYMTHRCTIDSITVKSISFQKDMIRFLLEKIPCSHAIAARTSAGLHISTLVCPVYSKVFSVCKILREYISLCWTQVEERTCFPPDLKRGPGRQKKSRWQSWLELSRMRGSKPRKKHMVYRCSKCKETGHTKPQCKSSCD